MPRSLLPLICTLLVVLSSGAAGTAAADAAAGPAEARAASKQETAKQKRARQKRAKKARCRLLRRRAAKRPGRAARRARKRACARRSTRTIAQPKRLFARTSVWNAPLPRSARLSSESDRLVAALSGEVRSEVARNTGPWINWDKFSVPVYTVGERTPRVRVQLDTHAPALQRDFESVPIPVGARPAAGGDGSLTVYQPSTDTLWEFWLAHRGADGWHARWGGKMTRVSKNPGYFQDPWGGSGTSLSLLGGLMTMKEMQARRIDHALAIAIPNTAAGKVTWPAQRGDGRTTGPTAIPEGTHFRIDPSVNLSRLGLSPLGLAMAKAVQRYGMIVRDTSGCVVFYGEDPVTAGGDPYGRIFGGQYPNHLLRGFPWDRLQVVAPRGR